MLNTLHAGHTSTHHTPRRSLDRVALLFVALALACQPSREAQARAQLDQALGHMTAAVQMLESAHGDTHKLLTDALTYRSAHHAELHALRTQGEAVWQELDVATQTHLAADADAHAQPLLARMATAAQQFADARQALLIVRPFLLQASAHTAPANWQPWLPQQPDLPPALGAAPTTATGTSP